MENEEQRAVGIVCKWQVATSEFEMITLNYTPWENKWEQGVHKTDRKLSCSDLDWSS